jgi:TRAP-type uncharacterized transport system fused permease subunit
MALLGFYAMTAAFKGYFFNRTFVYERILLALAALLLFLPGDKSYMPLTHLTGLILFIALIFFNKMIFVDAREPSRMNPNAT